MKIIKHTFALLVVFLLAVSCFSPTLAANQAVTYTGRKDLFDFGAGSAFSKTDLFAIFKNVMPGDVLTETITVKNTATDSDYIKIYLRAKPHNEMNPLSENVANAGETIDSMHDFLSQLSMKVWNGDKLIFDGSPDKANQLSENVLLGTFNKNESATLKVELTVPITLDNRYANRVGEVDWAFVVEAFDRPSGPSSNNTQLTVRKLWDDDGKDRPTRITINLLKNGKIHEAIELSDENQWMYTWGKLSRLAKWTVEEANVPEGYTASYAVNGNTTVITNTKKSDTPSSPDDPGDTPDIPPDVPPGEIEDNPPIDVPDPGTDISPEITAPEAEGPVRLTVHKLWDDTAFSDRPDCVTVQLYNGTEGVEAVYLGEWNNWSYTWDSLSPAGDWKVIEVNIPKGYTPCYSAVDGVVTITNTATLIQTGQLNWPVPVLGGAGTTLLLAGLLLKLTKRNHKNEQA